MVAKFELVMVGFSGGHLGVGWGWVTMEIGFLGLGYDGDRVMGHGVA